MKHEKQKGLEMAVAAGGSIKQVIVRDRYFDENWEASKMVMFNLQLFNASTFKSLGIPVPPTPITANTYATYGYPFFKLDEDPCGIAGDFPLKTFKDLDQSKKKNQALHKAEEKLSFPVVEISGKSTVQNVPSNNEDSLEKEDIQDYYSDLGQEIPLTIPVAIKLNTVDHKSVFLPIRLLEKECQNENSGKGKGKRFFSEN